MANTPTRYQPNASYTRLPDVIDRLFRESVIPATSFGQYVDFFDGKQYSNLLETKDAYIVQLALPGVDINKVTIEVTGQQLLVKGMQLIPEVKDATYLYKGFGESEFSDTFELPMEVSGEKADATYNHGILTITLPKSEHAKPKTIKVHTVA